MTKTKGIKTGNEQKDKICLRNRPLEIRPTHHCGWKVTDGKEGDSGTGWEWKLEAPEDEKGISCSDFW
jgi:hypothetical protein